jgi:glycosyltransferase involved in cell wall biosynthesis
MAEFRDLFLFWFSYGLAGLFIFSCLIQIFFQWYFFYRIRSFKAQPAPTADFPPVSVVICARNELANLQKLIPLLLEQDYPDFEVVIIDDRSDDPMYDFMLAQKAEHKRVRLVRINYTPEGMNPKKFALTMGIRSARFENLVFTDADCFPDSPNWLRAMAVHMTGKEEIVLGYAPYFQEPGFLNLLIRYDTFYTAVQYFSFAMAGLPYMGVGRNLAYKKSLFMKLKGFYKHMPLTGGDDDLFVNRASTDDNIAMCLDPEGFTHSIPKTTWYSWYRQKTRHLSVSRFYKSGHKTMLGLLGLTHLLFYFTLPAILWIPMGWTVALAGYVLKTLNQMIVLRAVNSKLKEPISIWAYPILDFVHGMFIFAFSIPARFSRRATWM